MKHLHFLLIGLLLFSCRTAEKPFLSHYLHTGNLTEQTFIINPDADTTLTSSGGVKIKISKGTFDTDEPVTIEWKEALDFQSMLKAGLTTQTGNELLRSGGMFYFATKEELSIEKPIGIDVPTETIVSGMKLYKGDSSSGKLDWKDPKPIENVSTLKENLYGKALFDNNCASCHRVDRDLTGPSLLGITERRSKQWLYAITRNSAAMASIDPVICCQKRKYGVIMQAFPALTTADMDSIYNYIDYETVKQRENGTPQGFGCDNCAVTNPAYDRLLDIYNQLYAATYLQKDSTLSGKADTSEKRAEISWGKVYYQVSIQSDGWYNIDVLLKDCSAAESSNLIVFPQGERSEETEYYLAIPAMKILVRGTVQNKGETVVFDEANGRILLPQQRGAFIIAAGGTDGKYFFAKKDFTTSTSLTINLPIQTILKQQFEAQLNEIEYYGLNVQVETITEDSDTTEIVANKQQPKTQNSITRYNQPLRRIEEQLKKLAAQKFKDCGCSDLKEDGTTTRY